MKQISQMEPWLGQEERDAMAAYMASGGWLTEHVKTREFESIFAKYVGSKHAAAVNNGTVSLVIAVMALRIRPGDEVIVPDYTMIASANGILLAGGTPVFVDVDPMTVCLDLEKTESAITPRTRAIMYVNINGRSPQMLDFVALARKHNIALIEDAAQTLGCTFQGKHLGTFGAIGSYSFSTPKIITTGQGGMLVTDDEELSQRIIRLKDFGRAKAGIDYHESIGTNAKFTDMQAVIGLEQMKKLPWRVRRKKDMYARYHANLKGLEQIRFIDTDLKECAPWFIDILVTGKGKRDELAAYLKKNGVGTRPFYPAIHTQPPYAHVRGDFANSMTVSEQGLWLPSSTFLTDEDIDYVCQHIRDYFAK